MKNNVLSAFVVFFAVVACLLILDDISYKKDTSKTEATQKNMPAINTSDTDMAISELDIED